MWRHLVFGAQHSSIDAAIVETEDIEVVGGEEEMLASLGLVVAETRMVIHLIMVTMAEETETAPTGWITTLMQTGVDTYAK